MSKERPYFKYSIVQLEKLFDEALSDTAILRQLANELDYRETERAGRLRDSVSQVLAAGSTQPGKTTRGNDSTVIEKPSPQTYTPRQAPERRPETVGRPVRPHGTALPPNIDLRELPSIPRAQGANEPPNILTAWTALEALSPQTYRRPEDLAAGDRSCVADLASGRIPWGTGERSRPKRQLYYQVVLGAIPMDRATDALVKAFGEDEERAARPREKAALAAVLIDKNGMIVEENGIAVSSFACPLSSKASITH